MPLAAACLAVVAILAPPALAGPAQAPTLDELWSAYPLQQQRGRARPPASDPAPAQTAPATGERLRSPSAAQRPQRTPRRTQRSPSADSGFSLDLPPAAYALAVLVGALVGAAIVARERATRRRRRVTARRPPPSRELARSTRGRQGRAWAAPTRRRVVGRLGWLARARVELAIWVVTAFASLGLAYVIVVFLSSGRLASP